MKKLNKLIKNLMRLISTIEFEISVFIDKLDENATKLFETIEIEIEKEAGLLDRTFLNKLFEKLNINIKDNRLRPEYYQLKEITDKNIIFIGSEYTGYDEWEETEISIPTNLLLNFDESIILNAIEEIKIEEKEKEETSKKERYEELKQELSKLEEELKF